MPIPEEDLGPAWLSGYGRIEADIEEMAAFAHKLIDDIRTNYVPHADLVAADMEAEPPQPVRFFLEHTAFLDSHRTAVDATRDNVYWYIEGGTRLGNAAAEISRRYADADAFSAAQVADVQRALQDAGALPVDGEVR